MPRTAYADGLGAWTALLALISAWELRTGRVSYGLTSHQPRHRYPPSPPPSPVSLLSELHDARMAGPEPSRVAGLALAMVA
ncbi:hypothetical protein GCM10020229_11120 [Kitasatospora albolonga]